ncbi:MAG: hypothetical protein HYU64_20370 [Armatimonadetes bacterium]|nr:hypothetical protein [Armatimonadota bacterium]
MMTSCEKGLTFWELLVLLILAAGAALFVMDRLNIFHQSRRPSGQFTACQINVKNLSTALEIYSMDNDGHYPPTGRLVLVTPIYLKTMPKCPTAGSSTYLLEYRSTMHPRDSYSFGCSGINHENMTGRGESGPWCQDGMLYKSKDQVPPIPAPSPPLP